MEKIEYKRLIKNLPDYKIIIDETIAIQTTLKENYNCKKDFYELFNFYWRALVYANDELDRAPFDKIDWDKIRPIILKYFIGEFTKKRTFALPSHPIMFTLLALFSGKPERIPRKLLEKPYKERTQKEQKEADEFLNSILNTDVKKTYDDTGKEITETKTLALISNSPIVEAKAEINISLFSQDLIFREGALAMYIKRTFGAEGLRHLLGLVIGLEENYRQGFFEWNINEHLNRLGYKKERSGAYKLSVKKTATEIVKIFSSLFLTARRMDKKGKETIQGERLFSIDGFKIETFDKEIIDETLKIRATDFWYKNAFDPPDGKAPMYTKLLKKIAQENHRNHPLTIYLAPILAIFWRMKPDQKLSIESLMRWCDLDTKDPHKKEKIKDIEAELNYMKDKEYLREWVNSGENPLPSKCKEPLKCVLTFTPPEWLEKEIKEITDRKERFLPEPRPEIKELLLTKEEFARLLNNTGLTQKQFANNLGISRQMISYIIHGKRKLTQKTSDKTREVFGYMLPV